MTTPHLFCFGLGYSATKLAERFLEKGWRVSGTCRTMEKCESFRPQGITAHIFDTDLPLMHPEVLSSVTHILHSVPPAEEDPVYTLMKDELLQLDLLQWFGYLSTTGVYGDHDGQWVDETTPTNPNHKRGKAREKYEQFWLDSGLPTHIFRLSGIYGPGRSSFDSLKKGTARRIDKPGQVFSRIHVEDIVQILDASINRPAPGSIYNCADDMPAPQSDVVAYAAELMGIEPPALVPFDEAELSEMARSFYSANRRVRNDKIKEELGVELQYPDYRVGLKAFEEDVRQKPNAK